MPVHEFLAQAEGLEDLGAAVGRATVEMPILDITFRTPLPSALTRLRTGPGVMPVIVPERTIDSTVSIAR